MVKVLIVDDEAPILQSTAAILQECGFEVATVSEARNILPALRVEAPHVLLQDVRMPGLVLGDLVAEVRREHPALPVVLFSASLSLPDLQDACDVERVVEKPFHPDTLVAALHGAIAQRAAREALA
jgi:DNA-binding NtrC family response regulator